MSEEKTLRLTNRQRLFVEEYLVCWNATEAARRAGYRGDANTVGPRLLVNVGVKRLIEQRLKEKAMGADEILTRLSEQASANMGDFLILEKGRPMPKPPKGDEEEDEEEDDAGDLPEDDEEEAEPRVYLAGINWEEVKRRGHLIKKITPTRYGYTIELVDGQAALVWMGKHRKLFTEQVEHSGTVDLGGTVDKALKKIYGDNSDSGT